MIVNNISLKEVTNKYEKVRHISREVTRENLSSYYADSANIDLQSVDEKAITASKTWLNIESSRPRAEWSWTEAAKIYRNRYPKRFELAIWYNSKLCGLSFGRPSYASTRMRIELIEGAPRVGNPLGPRRVVPITIMNATAYAGILGAKELRIMRPAKALVDYYESLGFAYEKGTCAVNYPDCLYKILK